MIIISKNKENILFVLKLISLFIIFLYLFLNVFLMIKRVVMWRLIMFIVYLVSILAGDFKI